VFLAHGAARGLLGASLLGQKGRGARSSDIGREGKKKKMKPTGRSFKKEKKWAGTNRHH